MEIGRISWVDIQNALEIIHCARKKQAFKCGEYSKISGTVVSIGYVLGEPVGNPENGYIGL